MIDRNGVNTYNPQAYDPSSSYALSASAGSGKTFALTMRLLGMLLSDIPPGEILAITFTKLAANEIRDGLFSRLTALESGSELETEIFRALLKKDKASLVQKAREIRISLVERFSSLRVCTIHSFLGSVLGQIAFLEKGSTPRKSAYSEEGSFQRQKMFTWEHFLPELDIIDEQEKRGVLGEAFEDFYRELESESNLLEKILDFVRTYKEGRAKTERIIREIYNTVSQKSFILQEIIEGEESERKELLSEFNARRGDIRSEETKSMVELMAEICSFYMEERGGNKNLRLFEKNLREFIEYRNPRTLYNHPAFTRTPKQGPILYLKTLLENVGEKKALLFGRAFERIGEGIRLYLSSEMDYFIDSWFEIFRRVRRCYDERKRRRQIIDFDDIELLALSLFRSLDDFDLLDYRLGSRIRFVLIDEFQDTSESQWEALRHIVRRAVEDGGNVFYVGDTKQSIYRFRGGMPWLFEKVRKELGIGKRDLVHNYRQNPLLLGFVNGVFSRIAEDLFPEYEYNTQLASPKTKKLERGFLLIERYEDREKLLNGLIEKVRELEDGGVSLEDIAVLCRTNTEAKEVESLFLSHRIPYRTAGKSLLMNDYAVLDIVNLMKLCTSPKEPIFIAGFLRSPMAGFGYRDLEKLQYKRPEPMYSSDQALSKMLHSLIETSRYMLPSETLWQIYERFDPLGFYPQNREGLMDLIEAALAFEEGSEVPTLERFIRWLEENRDTLPIKSGAGRGVTVQTIHASKGLEYHTVIIPYLSNQFKLRRDGSLVYTRNPDGSINRYGIASPQYARWLSEMRGMEAVMDESNREYRIDELNILYVAITRAKENLLVLPLGGKGQTIGDMLLKALDPEMESAGGFADGFFMSEGSIVPSERDMERVRHTYERYSPETVAAFAVVGEKEPIPSPLDIRKRRSGILKGLLFHKVLELSQNIPSLQEIDGLVQRAMLQVGTEYTDEERKVARERAKLTLVNIVADSRLFRYFTREAMAEVETLSEQYPNLIGRADRVVIGGTVSVVDFKTDEVGNARDLKRLVRLYAPQVEGYCRSFANLYRDRCIEGWLYFTDVPEEDRLIKVYEKEKI